MKTLKLLSLSAITALSLSAAGDYITVDGEQYVKVSVADKAKRAELTVSVEGCTDYLQAFGFSVNWASNPVCDYKSEAFKIAYAAARDNVLNPQNCAQYYKDGAIKFAYAPSGVLTQAADVLNQVDNQADASSSGNCTLTNQMVKDLQPGWNLVGTGGGTSNAAVFQSAKSVYAYRNGKYVGYNPATEWGTSSTFVLQQFEGAWVLK